MRTKLSFETHQNMPRTQEKTKNIFVYFLVLWHTKIISKKYYFHRWQSKAQILLGFLKFLDDQFVGNWFYVSLMLKIFHLNFKFSWYFSLKTQWCYLNYVNKYIDAQGVFLILCYHRKFFMTDEIFRKESRCDSYFLRVFQGPSFLVERLRCQVQVRLGAYRLYDIAVKTESKRYWDSKGHFELYY